MLVVERGLVGLLGLQLLLLPLLPLLPCMLQHAAIASPSRRGGERSGCFVLDTAATAGPAKLCQVGV
jgi:hypothetical protein